MQNAIEQLTAFGLIVGDAIDYGVICRVPMSDQTPSKSSGWYILHEMLFDSGEKVLVGAYGDHREGVTHKIELTGRVFSDTEKLEYKKKLTEQRDAAQKHKKELAKETAVRAERIWAGLEKYTTGKSEYLLRKHVKAVGVRFSRGSIIVPVCNIGNELVGLQFIKANGDKRFLTGTAKRGAFHMLGNVDDDDAPLCIAEGYADAATIYIL